MKKEKVTKLVDFEYINWDYETLAIIKAEIDKLIEKYGDQAEIRHYDDYGDERLGLFVERDETDEEYEARIIQEEYYKEIRRKSYEAMKKEFES